VCRRWTPPITAPCAPPRRRKAATISHRSQSRLTSRSCSEQLRRSAMINAAGAKLDEDRGRAISSIAHANGICPTQAEVSLKYYGSASAVGKLSGLNVMDVYEQDSSSRPALAKSA